MALIRSGLREARPLEPGDGAARGLVIWGQSWAQWNGFELSDVVAGELGFLWWHSGGNADHLLQHAREHGREIRTTPKPPEVVRAIDWEKSDAKIRGGLPRVRKSA